MKNKPAIFISGCFVLLLSLNSAFAQAPSPIAGDGFLISITSGTYPFASYGYYLFVPGNSGNTYQSINIYNVNNSSGTYTYTPTSPSQAIISINDSVAGSGTVGATFLTANSGSFHSTLNSFSSAYQNGVFNFASASAPGSVVGKTIVCNISDGNSPFYNSGSFTFYISASGNTYTTSFGSSGTYSYSLVNQSTGKLQLTDVQIGSFVAYFGYTDALHGGYAATQSSSGGFQVANFQVLDTTPPTVAFAKPTNGQRWSNAVFSVTGTAGDNAQVASVWYQINGQGWNTATTGNQWSNWTAQVALTPGTNTIAAYSVDTSGNFSLTNSVSFQFVVTNQLQVFATGLGTISPNYSNAWLEIGRNYSMIAKPGAGFRFTNWTGSLIAGAATLNFTMASNLMFFANFTDTNRPVFSITNLTAGRRWSNAVFIVLGNAGDNWIVSNVWYQLNELAWSNAVTANAWTNWSAVLNLVPGTNSIRAYAMDSSGNASMTNSLNFDFVVTNQFQIRTTGRGTISPNYSNAWLEIGRNYNITSAPASGFVFTNWLVSTNWLGGVAVTATKWQFMMQSNLTVQANFLDVTKPSLTIVAPTSGQKMTNALATIVGRASDNWQVSNVWYQLNGGAWSQGMTTNSYTNWTSPLLTLVAGTNLLNACALDLAGNLSATSSVSFVSSNTFKLQMNFALPEPLTPAGLNFSLQISPGLNGHIQVSTNLATWTALTNFIGTNTTLNFHDPAATNSSQRFYRAVIP